ncbi:uncharacterized protein LOC127749082 [Frankliniella occidentalis]|uniref:Uncharacterized protein LOC127749082 n=1 Tax=Frankliniella occidentalis TaxID=133901 RepID=A0A9C6WWM0_FRAOC|nr:uncharacterized protein LOC127749082 [Frankliniella occidentalis]
MPLPIPTGTMNLLASAQFEVVLRDVETGASVPIQRHNYPPPVPKPMSESLEMKKKRKRWRRPKTKRHNLVAKPFQIEFLELISGIFLLIVLPKPGHRGTDFQGHRGTTRRPAEWRSWTREAPGLLTRHAARQRPSGRLGPCVGCMRLKTNLNYTTLNINAAFETYLDTASRALLQAIKRHRKDVPENLQLNIDQALDPINPDYPDWLSD